MYEEMAGQILSKGKAFLDAGIQKEAMQSELEKIEKHLQTDFTKLNEKELKKLSDNIKKAENMISSANVQTERKDYGNDH